MTNLLWWLAAWIPWHKLAKLPGPVKSVPLRKGSPDVLLDRYFRFTPYNGKIGHWWRKRFPSAFIHHLKKSDPDRGFHNHPWTWARSLILEGSYIELTPSGWQYFRPGDVNRIDVKKFHRIELENENEGVWTLFVVGPRKNDGWGFVDEYGNFTPEDSQ